jgi:hypothetical protein
MPRSRRCSDCQQPTRHHAKRDGDKAVRVTAKIHSKGSRRPDVVDVHRLFVSMLDAGLDCEEIQQIFDETGE